MSMYTFPEPAKHLQIVWTWDLILWVALGLAAVVYFFWIRPSRRDAQVSPEAMLVKKVQATFAAVRQEEALLLSRIEKAATVAQVERLTAKLLESKSASTRRRAQDARNLAVDRVMALLLEQALFEQRGYEIEALTRRWAWLRRDDEEAQVRIGIAFTQAKEEAFGKAKPGTSGIFS